ncbi:uncharacterized protein LOC126983611 isoform X2 [Eriocheir sinensis]|uniref:uncharacterized protein LOC126983611 isoform X2 n=1 Tax=Eriocheir sinensis TaxID=95602 RepID=UPI0021C96608|nr:uncharacterized protein LOC126983611 isoform X2 [Eriocheir sinensis]
MKATMTAMVVTMVVMVMVVVVMAADTDDEANLISSRSNISTGKCTSPHIPNAQITPHKRSYLVGEVVTLHCPRGFMPRWEHKLHCGTGGIWKTQEGFTVLPRCRSMQCGPPESIPKGKVQVIQRPGLYNVPVQGWGGAGVEVSEKDIGGEWLPENTLAEYSCEAGYRLQTSLSPRLPHHLTCHHGEWQGEVPQCVSQGCSAREPVMNGYYLEVTGSWDGQEYQEYPAGARIQFVCHTGYILRGPDRFLCQKGGVWVPRKVVPQCEPSQQLIGAELCPVPPEVPHTLQKLVRGVVAVRGAVEGTEVAYRCLPRYRNTLAPCITHTLTCRAGQWVGTSPECEPFNSCMPPQNIPHGTLSDSASSFPVQAQVYYQCVLGYKLMGPSVSVCLYSPPPPSPPHCLSAPPQVYYQCVSGYKLMGPSVVTCQEYTGCWTPRLPPVCQRLHQYSREEPVRGDSSILDIHTILVATTGSVIGILLIVLALILYQRAVSPKLVRLRSSGSGGVVDIPPAPHPRPASAPPPHPDHDPDRVALIAFPDEGVPPTYEEAVRHRPAILFEPPTAAGTGGGGAGRYTPHAPRSRTHRVGVPGVVGVAVGGRRSRHRDNPDNISYQSIGSARQSSSWSACDSLGSTDTVAAASDSTNVTVDTQSSGGVSTGSAPSQAPSCRALAGSLASFDTSSLVNNEGAPLLEEAEVYDGSVEEPPTHPQPHHPHPHHQHHHHHRGEDDHLSLRDTDSLKDHNTCPTPNPPHPRPPAPLPPQE